MADPGPALGESKRQSSGLVEHGAPNGKGKTPYILGASTFSLGSSKYRAWMYRLLRQLGVVVESGFIHSQKIYSRLWFKQHPFGFTLTGARVHFEMCLARSVVFLPFLDGCCCLWIMLVLWRSYARVRACFRGSGLCSPRNNPWNGALLRLSQAIDVNRQVWRRILKRLMAAARQKVASQANNTCSKGPNGLRPAEEKPAKAQKVKQIMELTPKGLVKVEARVFHLA